MDAPQIATNVGINLGFIVGYMLSDLDCDAGWRTMLGAGAVLPLVMLVLVGAVMPESPRWLVRKGRAAEATAVLATLYPPGTDVDEVQRPLLSHRVAPAARPRLRQALLTGLRPAGPPARWSGASRMRLRWRRGSRAA